MPILSTLELLHLNGQCMGAAKMQMASKGKGSTKSAPKGKGMPFPPKGKGMKGKGY